MISWRGIINGGGVFSLDFSLKLHHSHLNTHALTLTHAHSNIHASTTHTRTFNTENTLQHMTHTHSLISSSTLKTRKSFFLLPFKPTHPHTHIWSCSPLYLSLVLCTIFLSISLALSPSCLNPTLAPSSFSPWGKHNLDSLILSLWEETSLRLKNFLPQISFLKKQLGSNNDQIEKREKIFARNFGKNWFIENLRRNLDQEILSWLYSMDSDCS